MNLTMFIFMTILLAHQLFQVIGQGIYSKKVGPVFTILIVFTLVSYFILPIFMLDLFNISWAKEYYNAHSYVLLLALIIPCWLPLSIYLWNIAKIDPPTNASKSKKNLSIKIPVLVSFIFILTKLWFPSYQKICLEFICLAPWVIYFFIRKSSGMLFRLTSYFQLSLLGYFLWNNILGSWNLLFYFFGQYFLGHIINYFISWNTVADYYRQQND